MGPDAKKALAYFQSNREWASHVAGGGSDRVGEAFHSLNAADRHEVWLRVRSHLGLTAIDDPSAPRPVEHHDGPPEHPVYIGPDETPATGGQGSPDPLGDARLPEDGIDGTANVGVGASFGAAPPASGHGHDRFQLRDPSITVQTPQMNDPLTYTYNTPTAAGPDHEPANPADAIVAGVREMTAEHHDPTALAAQAAALHAVDSAIQQLGSSLHGEPSAIHAAVVVLLTAARDLMHAGGLPDQWHRFEAAYTLWDTQRPDLDAAGHDAWTAAGQSLHDSASTASAAWSQVHGDYLAHNELSVQYADLLADWATQTHADLTSAAHH